MKNENAIREAAYYIWQNAGSPEGNADYFWALAIDQLNKGYKKPVASAAARKPAPKKAAPKKR